MSFNINKLVNDSGDRTSIFGGEIFKTPRLPPVEELKLLKFWKVMLEMHDLEEELLVTHGKTVYDLVSEKTIDKECPKLNLAGALRAQAGLGASSSPKTGSPIKHTETPKQPKTISSSETSKSNLLSGSQSGQRSNSYKRMYSMSTRDFHPDEILLRFLVQQDWDIGMAFRSLTLTGLFRLKWDLDELMRSGEQGALTALKSSKDQNERVTARGFLNQCEIGKTFVRGMDREGRPVVITRLRLNDLQEHNAESVKKFILWQVECGRLMLGPAVTDVVSVWDFKSSGIENVYVSLHRFMVDIFQKYFPGAFSVLLIHRSPKFFESIWDVVKGWLSPQSTEKVKFTRSVEDLEQYIPRENIIKELGGDDPWEFDYIPVQEGENDIMKDLELEQSIRQEHEELWNKCNQLTRQMVDLAADGQDYGRIKKQRNDLVIYMRASYWKLDPFIRARSYYDRMGLIALRRESAFMTLAITQGKTIDPLRPRLEAIASHSSSLESTPDSGGDDDENEDDEGDDDDEDE